MITAESTYTNWSLFNRLCLVLEVLDAAILAGPAGMALVFTWLRLSANRTLPWYKNSNYQSKDIAHVQKSVAQTMADKVKIMQCTFHQCVVCVVHAFIVLDTCRRPWRRRWRTRYGVLYSACLFVYGCWHMPLVDEG